MHASDHMFHFVTILQGWAYKTQKPTTLQGWVYKTQQNTWDESYSWRRSFDVFFVTILQGWVYKTQQQHVRCVMIVTQRFLCNNIAMMGLQNTINNNMWDAWWSSDVAQQFSDISAFSKHFSRVWVPDWGRLSTTLGLVPDRQISPESCELSGKLIWSTISIP